MGIAKKKSASGDTEQEMQQLAASGAAEEEEGEELEEEEEETSEPHTDSIDSITEYTITRLRTHQQAQMIIFLSLLAVAVSFCFLVPWRLLSDAHNIARHHQSEDGIVLRMFSIGDANRSIQEAQSRFLHYIWSQDPADADAVNAALDNTRDILNNLAEDDSNLKVTPAPGQKALCNETLVYVNEWNAYLRELMITNAQTKADTFLYEKFQMEYRELRVTEFYNEILEKLYAEMVRIQNDYIARDGHTWSFQEHHYVPLLQAITRDIAHDMDFDAEILAFGDWHKIETRVENEATVAHEIQELQHLEIENPDHGTLLTIEELQSWYDRFLDPQFVATLHLVFTDRKDGSKFLLTFGNFLRQMRNETGIFLGDWDSSLMRVIEKVNEMNRTEETRLKALYSDNPQDVGNVVKQAIVWAFIVAVAFTVLIFFLYNPFFPCVYTELRVGGCNFLLCLVVSLGIFVGVCGIAGTAAQKAIDREADHEAATQQALGEVTALNAAMGEWNLALSVMEESLITGSADKPLLFQAALRDLAQDFASLREAATGHAYATRTLSQIDAVLNATARIRASLEHWGIVLLKYRKKINTAIIDNDELTHRLNEAHHEQVEVESHLQQLHHQIDTIIEMGSLDDRATRHVRSELVTFENLYLKTTGNGLAFLEDTVGGELNPTYVHYQEYRDKCYKQGRYLEAIMEEWIHGPPVPNRLTGLCAPGRLCMTDVRAMEGAIEHVIGEFDHFWHEIDKLIVFKQAMQSEEVFDAEDMQHFYMHNYPHIESINNELKHLLDNWRSDMQTRVKEQMPQILEDTKGDRYQLVWSSIIGLWTLCLYWRAMLHAFFDGFSAASLPRPQAE